MAIVTGAGERAFSAGADLKEMASLSPAERKALAPAATAACRGIELWKPVIAAISGYCIGGAFEMAMGCDIRIATEDATFRSTEVSRGLNVAGGGTWRLPRLVPVAIAMETYLCCTPIAAQRAYELGLVNRVVPRGQHIVAALEMARLIAGHSPAAVRSTKELLVRGLDLSREESYRLEDHSPRILKAMTWPRARGPLWRSDGLFTINSVRLMPGADEEHSIVRLAPNVESVNLLCSRCAHERTSAPAQALPRRSRLSR